MTKDELWRNWEAASDNLAKGIENNLGPDELEALLKALDEAERAIGPPPGIEGASP